MDNIEHFNDKPKELSHYDRLTLGNIFPDYVFKNLFFPGHLVPVIS